MQKIAALAVKHNMSQNEVVDIILESVNDVVIDAIVVEVRQDRPPRSRTLSVKKVATWG